MCCIKLNEMGIHEHKVQAWQLPCVIACLQQLLNTFDTFRLPVSACMYMCMYGSRAAMGLATGTATCCAQFMHAHMDCSPVLRCAMRRWLLAKAPTAGLS